MVVASGPFPTTLFLFLANFPLMCFCTALHKHPAFSSVAYFLVQSEDEGVIWQKSAFFPMTVVAGTELDLEINSTYTQT